MGLSRLLPPAKEAAMAKYLTKVSYNADGIKGVMKEGGSSRVATVEKALAGLGGSLESFYFAFGDSDVYVISDLPDHQAAVAFAAAIGASGALSKVETIVLLTASEIDSALTKAVDYRRPGA
jgi:uncharacterized protein with GYD domain